MIMPSERSGCNNDEVFSTKDVEVNLMEHGFGVDRGDL